MLRTTLRIALTAIALTIAALPALSAQAALPPNDPDAGWIVDGQVNALARDGQTLYVGGAFEFLNRRTGGGFRATPAGDMVPGPEFGGGVTSVIRDGGGGFYAGGHFRTIDGEPYERLAHVLADGTIDTAFRPPPMNDVVGALAIAGDKLIIGGQFSSVDNQPRRGIAALDLATGTLDTSFRPTLTGNSRYVYDLAATADGETVYAGGSFECAGGTGGGDVCGDNAGEEPRLNAAAFDTADGALRAWDPGVANYVSGIEIGAAGTVFVSGSFRCVNSADEDCTDLEAGQDQRRGFAEVDATTGSATSLVLNVGDPGNASAVPSDMLLDGDVITLVGSFGCARYNGDADCTDLNERSRRGGLQLETDGTLLDWNPDISGQVRSVTREPGGAFWLGGEFAQASGQARKNLAVVDPGTGALLPHDLHPNHSVAALAFSGGHVFVGGSFTGAGGPARENLAAIDLQSGVPTAFDPRPDDEVVTLAVGHGRLYAGGQFQAVGGVPRPYLAAFDLPSQTLSAWAPEPDDEVNAIAADAGTVYVGGYFAKLGGVDQESLAALDPATAASRPGFPQADDVVRGLAIADGRLFVGGEFDGTDSFGGEDRDYLAAVDLATGQAAPWAPTPDAIVFSIAAGGGRVFAGGTFEEVDGAPRTGVAGLDAASGAVLDWDAGLDTNDEVHGLALDGETVGLAGAIDEVNGVDVPGSAALVRATDAATLGWEPRVESTVFDIELAGGAVYLGGDFYGAGPIRQSALATYTPPPVNLAPPVVTASQEPQCDPGRWEGNPALTTTIATVGGNALTCRVTARNIRGEAVADSAAVEIPRRPEDGTTTTKPAGAPRITLTARTGKGVRKAKSGRYVVRYGSTLQVTGTVTGADGAPLSGARLGLLRGKAKPLGLTADARGRFTARITRPKKAVHLVAEIEGARATLRADVVAALRFTAGKVQSGRRVTIAGRVAVPKAKGLAGRIEVLRGTKVLARIAVRRSGAFRAKVAQPRGKASYRVRFVPRKGTGLAVSLIRARVRRI